MSVWYRVMRGNQVVAERDSAGCFGNLSHTPVGSHNNPLTSILYRPFFNNPTRLDEKECKMWIDHLLTIPFVKDSLVDGRVMDFNYRRKSGFEINVRLDIPADRVLNVLCIFRYMLVGQQAVRDFCRMVECDVDPSIAFTLAVGALCHGSSATMIRPSVDTEHSFVDQIHFSLEDAIKMSTVMYCDDWREHYNGRQRIYSQTGTYTRGASFRDDEVRLTAFAGPTIAQIWASEEKDVCLPYLVARLFNKDALDRQRVNMGRLGNVRSSNLYVSFEQLLEAASWLEDKVNEQR